jgi:two-component system sensor histidine kinase ResE
LKALQTRGPFAIMVTDLMMPDMHGLELLRKARRMDPHLEVIVITAVGSMESAISAMREDGAYDYLTKPLESISELSLAVGRARDYRRLQLEREALQARSLAEAELLRSLLANIDEAIISADAAGRLTVTNPAADRLLDWSNPIGQAALSALPEPLAKLVANWQAIGNRRPATIEIAWPAGAVRMVSLSAIGGPPDQPGGWVLTMRDITHLKRLDDLKMDALTETVGRIRLPLVEAINLLAELSYSPEVKSGKTAADLVYRLGKVWNRIQEWSDSLNDLLQFESGLEIHVGDVELGQILDDTINKLSPGPLRSRQLQIKREIDPNLPKVRVDRNLLYKTLRVLLNRAVQRSEASGTIRLTAYEHQQQVWIDITDAGKPIAESERPHLFDRTIAGGDQEITGLELAMTKAIIDRIGGQVWVRDLGSSGNTITVCLPAIESPA